MIEDADTLPAVQEQMEPLAAQSFMARIKSAEKAASVWQEKCDNIGKQYADLSSMADTSGDREFKMFWANLEVLRPTIYQRPPQPVVMPRHKDGNDVHRKAAEMLERALLVDVETDDLHETLKLVRDDLALSARGTPWVLDTGECIHVDRRDFVHEPARKWREVGWVARRAYMTREEVEARFPDADARHIAFTEKTDTDDDFDGEQKASIWEFWDKSKGQVVWITEGHEATLDRQPPLVNVKGFFPCPKPAYGTIEPGTLKPVPDFVYYRDQVDEINEITARISALSESLRLKGFYPSGSTEIGEAIETAMAQTSNKAILVPVPNLAALGGQSMSQSIVWLPVDQIAQTISSLVQLRQQFIQDVYEITGLSDIMRGATNAQETATAQNLKAQYGSIRVRERQGEMTRVARDVLRIKAEIFAEVMPINELAEMAQMNLLTMAQVQQQMMQQQMAQQAQMQQPQQPGQPPQGPPAPMEMPTTIEAVAELLQSQKVRPFVLEVESDSTISPNEEAEKQSRTEFVQAIGAFISQAGPMVQANPETGPFVAEMFKFAAGAFRASRELGPAIDDLATTISAKSEQGQQGPSPEAMKAQADMQMAQQKAQMEGQKAQADMAKMQADMQAMQQKTALEAQQAQADLAKTGAEIRKIEAEIARIVAQVQQQPMQGSMQ